MDRLAAILILGPRIGRFGRASIPIRGHDLPMTTVGVFILWFGWFGFNGGSTLGVTDEVPTVIVNTTLSAAFGGLAALGLTWIRDGRPDVATIMNGSLAGLVGITASANIMATWAAVVIGRSPEWSCAPSRLYLSGWRSTMWSAPSPCTSPPAFRDSLRLMQRTAAAANEAVTVEEAMRICVEEVCSYTGWPVGHAYLVDEEGSGELVPSDIWRLADQEQFAQDYLKFHDVEWPKQGAVLTT